MFAVRNQDSHIAYVAKSEGECLDYLKFNKEEGRTRVPDVAPHPIDEQVFSPFWRLQVEAYDKGYDEGCNAPDWATRWDSERGHEFTFGRAYEYTCGYRAGLSDRGAEYRPSIEY